MASKKLIKQLSKASQKAAKNLDKAKAKGDSSQIARHALEMQALDSALKIVRNLRNFDKAKKDFDGVFDIF